MPNLTPNLKEVVDLAGDYSTATMVDVRTKEEIGRRKNIQTIDERNFNAALAVMELHFERPMGYLRVDFSKSLVEVKKMVAKTLDLSLNKADVRFVSFSIFHPEQVFERFNLSNLEAGKR